MMPKFKELIPADLDLLREKISYSALNGRFFARKGVSLGKEIIPDKKARVSFGPHRILAARIAWAFETGAWPVGNVYFKDERYEPRFAFHNLRLRDETRYVESGSTQINKRTIYTYGLWKRYKITRPEYEVIAAKQNNCCAICRKPESNMTRSGRAIMLHVDHDHDTGQIRELLCSACNSMLGFSKENESLLHAAAEYLRRHRRAKFSVISEGSE